MFTNNVAIVGSRNITCTLESYSGEVYSIQNYVIKFLSDLCQVVVFPGYPGFLRQ